VQHCLQIFTSHHALFRDDCAPLSWDNICDVVGENGDGGVSTDIEEVINSDAKGHSYAFMEIDGSCDKDNNTDNRAYLGFYIVTLVTALIGVCCLLGEVGEAIYGTCLVVLFFWYLIMEGLRVREIQKGLQLTFDGHNDANMVFLSFYVSQFCLYGTLLLGLAFELFDIPCIQCVCIKTVVVARKELVEI